MAFNKHLLEVLEKFHLLTHLPIQAIDYNGQSIGSVAYSRNHKQLFDSYNIYNRILKERDREENILEATVEGPGHVYFTASPICPRNRYRGIFLIGPYSDKVNNPYNLVYKPLDLVDYLVKTLRFIWRDFPNKESYYLDRKVYNLHIRRAVDYIDSRYMDNISLEGLADYLGINKTYLSSLFRKETGETFSQYLNKIRIEKSKALLLDGNQSVLDIALAVGFTNQNYYNIMFKRITGLTPLEFRNRKS